MVCALQTTCRLNGERGEREAEGKKGFRGLSPSGVEGRAEASDGGVSGGPARKAQFGEYRQDGSDLYPRAEDRPRSMKSSDAAVEAWNGHGLPELARARREKVERINRDLNERRSLAVRPGSQPAERFESTPRTPYERQLNRGGRRTCGVRAAVRRPTNTLTP